MKEHGVMPAMELNLHNVHPGMILGWRQDGRPIRLIAGGAPDGDGGEGGSGEAGSGDQSGDTGGESSNDGDGGEKPPTVEDIRRLSVALDRERASAREGKVAARELAALKAQYGSETDKAIAAARDEAAKEAAGKFQTRLVRQAVRAAASRFDDPTDAALLLQDKFGEFLDDDGDVDERKVQKAVDDLLKAKPRLARDKPAPEFDGGQRNGEQGGVKSMDRLIRGSVSTR